MIKSLQLKSHRFKNVGRYILYDRPLVDHHLQVQPWLYLNTDYWYMLHINCEVIYIKKRVHIGTFI